MNKDKKYYCQKCGKEIGYFDAKYGTGLCYSCNKEKTQNELEYIYKICKDTNYQDIGNKRIDFGLYYIEEDFKSNIDIMVELSNYVDLEKRLNKIDVFVGKEYKEKAYLTMIKLNIVKIKEIERLIKN